MIIDTHCHLDFPEFDADREETISRAREAGVIAIINIGTTLERSRDSVRLAEHYPEVYATVGVHPHDAESINKDTLDVLEKIASHPKVKAIGEVGLDYYRMRSPKKAQRHAFRMCVRMAGRRSLPLVIHTREAGDEALAVLREEGVRGGAVMHCFSGNRVFLRKCLDRDFYVSLTCNLTFSNAAALREVARYIPLDRLMLETDAPFLAPQPHRGERNEPAYLCYLVDELCRIRSLSREELESVTTANATRFFSLSGEKSADSREKGRI